MWTWWLIHGSHKKQKANLRTQNQLKSFHNAFPVSLPFLDQETTVLPQIPLQWPRVVCQQHNSYRRTSILLKMISNFIQYAENQGKKIRWYFGQNRVITRLLSSRMKILIFLSREGDFSAGSNRNRRTASEDSEVPVTCTSERLGLKSKTSVETTKIQLLKSKNT